MVNQVDIACEAPLAQHVGGENGGFGTHGKGGCPFGQHERPASVRPIQAHPKGTANTPSCGRPDAPWPHPTPCAGSWRAACDGGEGVSATTNCPTSQAPRGMVAEGHPYRRAVSALACPYSVLPVGGSYGGADTDFVLLGYSLLDCSSMDDGLGGVCEVGNKSYRW